jgi:hypothetical protein
LFEGCLRADSQRGMGVVGPFGHFNIASPPDWWMIGYAGIGVLLLGAIAC